MIELQKAQGWERQHQHPMLALMDQPNPYYDGLLLQAATISDLTITGNAYWGKLRAKAGNVLELWWLPSTLVEPKWAEGRYLDYYEYRPGMQVIKFETTDIVHFRDGLDPSNVRKGRSPLASLFREIFSDHEAANMTASLLRNLGVPGLVIAPKGDSIVSTTAAQKIKEEFKQKFTGDKRGEPLVIGAPTDVTVMGFSPQQMDLKALRRIPEERITAVIGVPAIVAGLGAGLDRSTYANYSEARESAYESTIIPLQRMAASVIKRQLLRDYEPDLEQWRVGYDLSEIRILQEDKDKQAVRLDTMVRGGWLAVDDAQRLASVPVDKSQHIYLRGALVMEVPAAGMKSAGDVEGLKDYHWKRVDGRRTAYWRPVAEKVKRLYIAEGKLVSRAVGGIGNPADEAEKAIESGRGDWEKALIAIDLELMRDFAKDFVPNKSNGHGEHKDFLGLDPFEASVMGWLRTHATKAVKSILASNLDDVKRILQEGVSEGASHYQMASQIRDYYDDRSEWKAMRVSRTEVATAAGQAQQQSAEQSGVVKTKTWLSARDARVRDSHLEVDGETVSLGEHFSNGLDYPGDPGGSPEEIIQCRCVAIYNVD